MGEINDVLDKRMEKANSLVCVGLDADIHKLPKRFRGMKFPQFEFNRWIIEETRKLVCAYKLNLAFYESSGVWGWEDLRMTVGYLKDKYSDIVVIADAKRGDIASTSEACARGIFDDIGFDAVTLSPYLGREALEPFLRRKDRASMVLCRTSNSGAGEFQDLEVSGESSEAKPLWQVVAERVADEWNENGNCMLLVGVMYPRELEVVRKIAGEMTLLVPGVGAQGGDVEAVVKAGLNSDKKGMVVSSSRGVIFDKDPAEAAAKLRDEVNRYR